MKMKGKLIYIAIMSLFSLLTVFENHYLFGTLSLLLLIYFHFSNKFSGRSIVIPIVVYFAFLFIGVLAVSSQVSTLDGTETNFNIQIIDEIKFDGNRLSAIAEVSSNGERMVLKYRIRSPQEKELLKKQISPGVICNLLGSLTPPGKSRNPNSFDYQLYLQRKGISWILESNGVNPPACSEPSGNLITLLKRVRYQEVNKLEENMDEENAAIFAALLFGERTLMDPEMEEAYSRTGTVHLLAISGLHVALLTGMCFAFLLRFGMTRERAELTLMLILPAYAVLTGLAPSVNRAVLMLILLLITRRLKLRFFPLDAISLAFIVLVIISPHAIYQPGFQLSFGVSFALVLSASTIINRFQSYLVKLIIVSLVAQLASIPILLNYFYEISLISVVANLLFVPLFSFILLPLVLVTYLSGIFVPFISELLFPLINIVVSFANTMSISLAAIPFSSVVIGKPDEFMLVLYLLCYLIFFIIWEKKGNRKIVPVLLLLPIIPIVFQVLYPYLSPYGKVVFIDVGQGDSILIRLPHNRANYLIDTGGSISYSKEEWEQKKDSFDTGEDILVPLLKSEGIRKLDKLILTHGDMDHIGGAPGILSELSVEEILLPITNERTELELRIQEIAKTKHIKMKLVQAGTRWKVAAGNFQVISPLEKLEDKNEGSIVLWASFGGKRWIFTGDLGEYGEKALVQRISQMDVDVLKIGHHGSKSSSSEEFLAVTRPEIAIISAGEGNRYGHPHPEVIDRLKKHKVSLFRTDKQGAIIYTFTNKSGTFRTWIP